MFIFGQKKEMKKLLLIIFLVLLSCKDEHIINNCFRGVKLNYSIYLSNPEFTNLNVPSGYVIKNIQNRTILIIRNNDNYKAFDMECPEKDCKNPMTFDGLKLICTCSKKEYNSLNASPINGKGCFALEYNTQRSGNNLIISTY